jgi:hypothetical protein
MWALFVNKAAWEFNSLAHITAIHRYQQQGKPFNAKNLWDIAHCRTKS